jgi:hypothetical protein
MFHALNRRLTMWLDSLGVKAYVRTNAALSIAGGQDIVIYRAEVVAYNKSFLNVHYAWFSCILLLQHIPTRQKFACCIDRYKLNL